MVKECVPSRELTVNISHQTLNRKNKIIIDSKVQKKVIYSYVKKIPQPHFDFSRKSGGLTLGFILLLWKVGIFLLDVDSSRLVIHPGEEFGRAR